MFDIAYICSDYNVASLNTSIDSIIEALATKSKVNFHIIDLGIAQEHKEKLALKLSKHHKNDWQFFNENKKDLFSPYLFFRGGGKAAAIDYLIYFSTNQR